MITILIILALLNPPPLRAVWERPGVARIAWSGAGCLWKDATFIQCYDVSGVLRLGDKGPLDGAYRPAAGDVFRFVRPDGREERSPLRGIVYFPVWR